MRQTRNAKGAGGIRQRPDGRWEARYTAGYDLRTGKQRRRSVYGKTKRECQMKLNCVLAELDSGTYFEPAKVTLGEWLQIWLDEYNAHVKPRTLESYRGHTKHRITPAIGRIKLKTLNATHLQRFYNDLLRGTPNAPALSPKTIHNIHGILHKALEQAVELGYIRFNPSDSCKLPRKERKQIQPLDHEQIRAFIRAIQGHRYETVYLVDLFTGMRQGEILGLQWGDIDFESGTIHIQKQLQRIQGEYHMTSLKNDKTRRITPAPAVMQALRKQRVRQQEWRLRAGELWQESSFVFTNDVGEHLRRETVYRNYKRIVADIGVPDARFHDMRHTYAVNALGAGDDVKTVQETLGHHTAAFTLDVYGHATEDMKRASANRMQQVIEQLAT